MAYAFRISKTDGDELVAGYLNKGWAGGSKEARQELWGKLANPVKNNAEKFRLLDDDKTPYLWGWFLGDDDATGFEPLDRFMYDLGVTEIQYREKGEWKTL